MRAEPVPGGLPLADVSLADQQALAEALAETAQCLVCIFDRTGRILAFNRMCEEATGWTAAEAVGSDARALVIPPEDHDAFDAFLAEVWETRLPSPRLGEWTTKDGGRRVVAWANRPLLGSDGAAACLVTAGLDVTEREQMIAELERYRGELERRLEEQSALRRVATLVASGADADAVLDAVSEEAAGVVGAIGSAVARYEEGEALVVGEWRGPGAAPLGKGTRIPLTGEGTLARVHRTGAAARTDRYDDVEGGGAALVRSHGVGSTAAAPISVSGGLWGALVIGSPTALPEDAEERLTEFAHLCSLAIGSAEAREQAAAAAAGERARSSELQRLVAEQAALRRVATLVAGDVPPEAVFAAVSEGAARVAGAESGAVARFDAEEETATIVGRWDDVGERGIAIGTVVSLHAEGVMGSVWKAGAPARVDDYERVPGEAAADLRVHGVRSVIAAPVLVSGRMWGAIAVGTTSAAALPPETEERLSRFAQLVTIAVSSAHAWEELLASRARIVQASDEERRRLGRNLHDGAQQRLVTALTFLRVAESRLDAQPDTAREVLGQAIEEIVGANQDLRELARGLHPVALSERGLGSALRTLTRNASVPVELDVVDERLPETIEVAAYYVASEALANASRYAGATRVSIRVGRAPGEAWIEVADDGAGGADPHRGTGLRGLGDRVEALRGRLEIDTAAQRGTTIRASFPL